MGGTADDQRVLQVQDLSVSLRLGKKSFCVVDKLSFDLYKGKTLALVGESGCGKSMTALACLRILPQPPALPPEGHIWYQGKDLLALSEKQMRHIRGASIAMIFQDPMTALNPVYTIGYQLSEVAQLHLGLFGEEAEERVIQALKEVGIPKAEERIWDYPHQLSGGMKQRVMIAMALMCEPDVLIADEPTTALDVTVQAQVLDLMRQLQKDRGMALLLITHDMGVVAEMADEVTIMYATEAVERGSVYDIFDNKKHPYTKGLFGSLPQLEGEGGQLEPIAGSVPPITQLPSGCHFHPRCPHAMEQCKEKAPPAFSFEKGHKACCWLYDGEGNQ